MIRFFLLLFLVSCSTKAPYKEEAASTLYGKAQNFLAKQSYKSAAEAFSEVLRQHPYSHLAAKSHLLMAYAYYHNQDYAEALANIDGFLELYPGHKDHPFALFLKGLIYYTQISGVEREQNMSHKALTVFKELIQRYPESIYAKNVRVKIDLIHDHIAGHNMKIGRFYQQQHLHLAALNRFRYVIDNLSTTTHTPEALYRQVESLLTLGLSKEAVYIGSLLGHNYTHSKWYKYAYALLDKLYLIDSSVPNNAD